MKVNPLVHKLTFLLYKLLNDLKHAIAFKYLVSRAQITVLGLFPTGFFPADLFPRVFLPLGLFPLGLFPARSLPR